MIVNRFVVFCYRLDIKGCSRQNVLSNIGRNRSSSTAFHQPITGNQRACLERRTSQTPANTLKIVRSVSRESVRSIHHCTCPCLNAQVRALILRHDETNARIYLSYAHATIQHFHRLIIFIIGYQNHLHFVTVVLGQNTLFISISTFTVDC